MSERELAGVAFPNRAAAAEMRGGSYPPFLGPEIIAALYTMPYVPSPIFSSFWYPASGLAPPLLPPIAGAVGRVAVVAVATAADAIMLAAGAGAGQAGLGRCRGPLFKNTPPRQRGQVKGDLQEEDPAQTGRGCSTCLCCYCFWMSLPLLLSSWSSASSCFLLLLKVLHGRSTRRQRLLAL